MHLQMPTLFLATLYQDVGGQILSDQEGIGQKSGGQGLSYQELGGQILSGQEGIGQEPGG